MDQVVNHIKAFSVVVPVLRKTGLKFLSYFLSNFERSSNGRFIQLAIQAEKTIFLLKKNYFCKFNIALPCQ